MNCLTWNLEWALPDTQRGDLIRQAIDAVGPEVVCYTEVKRDFVPTGHIIEAGADYGYSHDGKRRKVLLWSRYPWEESDIIGDPAMPGGRFASGVTNGIRFVGVCIPWKDAHVTSGRKDRIQWEDHLRYCEGLGRTLRRYAESNTPVCVLGDFNQRIPRANQPKRVAEALEEALPSAYSVATRGMTDADGYQLIDHYAVSAGVGISISKVIPKIAEDGTRLSDHVGVAASINAT